jgi:LPS export ABC transporter protein LptC
MGGRANGWTGGLSWQGSSAGPASREPGRFGGASLRPFALILAATVLAACQDDAVRPPVNVTAADSADQILEGMEHLITTDGVRRTRVIADTAYLYEATNLARLKVVKVTFYDANGNETSTVTSDSGIYHMRDGSMSAWGRVVATTPDNRRLQSAELKYDSRTRQISSDKPFVYDRGDQHLEGNGFTSDPDFRNVVTRQPHGGERTGGGGLLPGQ